MIDTEPIVASTTKRRSAMPKLTIEQRHQLEPAIVRERLDGLRTRLADKYGLTATWTSDKECKIQRTGASGTLRCEPERVVVQLDLSFALSPLKGRVEEGIRRELERALVTS